MFSSTWGKSWVSQLTMEALRCALQSWLHRREFVSLAVPPGKSLALLRARDLSRLVQVEISDRWGSHQGANRGHREGCTIICWGGVCARQPVKFLLFYQRPVTQVRFELRPHLSLRQRQAEFRMWTGWRDCGRGVEEWRRKRDKWCNTCLTLGRNHNVLISIPLFSAIVGPYTLTFLLFATFVSIKPSTRAGSCSPVADCLATVLILPYFQWLADGNDAHTRTCQERRHACDLLIFRHLLWFSGPFALSLRLCLPLGPFFLCEGQRHLDIGNRGGECTRSLISWTVRCLTDEFASFTWYTFGASWNASSSSTMVKRGKGLLEWQKQRNGNCYYSRAAFCCSNVSMWFMINLADLWDYF